MAKKIDLARLLAPVVRKCPKISRLARKLARGANPESVVLLDYPVNSRQRWGLESPHRALYDIINEHRSAYRNTLNNFLKLRELLVAIPATDRLDNNSRAPYWANDWIPPLDGVAIYGFIAIHRPKIYMEVGSGNSTKFARKAIDDFGLETKIISIDPEPRSEIDKLCDQAIRNPVEDIDPAMFDLLDRDDILFVDSSHRAFMNSDVTAIFLDIIPRLRSGVLVEIHDILLPYDYPQNWDERWYSEQYLMAMALLAKGGFCEIVLPNAFISHDVELKQVLAPLWNRPGMESIEPYGYSFWFRIK